MAKSANNHFSSYQVYTKLYNKFHTTFSHTSTKVLKGGDFLLYLLLEDQQQRVKTHHNLCGQVLFGIAFFTSLFGAREEKRREEKRRRDPTSLSCSQEQRQTISLTKLICYTHPLGHRVHKIKPTILNKTYVTHKLLGPLYLFTRIKPTILDKTYVTHEHWVLLFHKIKPTIL